MVSPVQAWLVLLVANLAGSFLNLIGSHDYCLVVKVERRLNLRRVMRQAFGSGCGACGKYTAHFRENEFPCGPPHLIIAVSYLLVIPLVE